MSPFWSLPILVHSDKPPLRGPTIYLQFKVLSYQHRNLLWLLKLTGFIGRLPGSPQDQ